MDRICADYLTFVALLQLQFCASVTGTLYVHTQLLHIAVHFARTLRKWKNNIIIYFHILSYSFFPSRIIIQYESIRIHFFRYFFFTFWPRLLPFITIPFSIPPSIATYLPPIELSTLSFSPAVEAQHTHTYTHTLSLSSEGRSSIGLVHYIAATGDETCLPIPIPFHICYSDAHTKNYITISTLIKIISHMLNYK